MCAVAIGSFDALLRAGPSFNKSRTSHRSRHPEFGLERHCIVTAKMTANGDSMFETHDRFIKGADRAKKARRRTNMHGEFLAIFRTIRCVSGGRTCEIMRMAQRGLGWWCTHFTSFRRQVVYYTHTYKLHYHDHNKGRLTASAYTPFVGVSVRANRLRQSRSCGQSCGCHGD